MGSDADGDDLTYEIDTDPESGNLTYQSEGAADVTYSPSRDFVGDDYFTYFVDDGKALSENAGMVDITVDECLPPSQEPPIAVKDIEVETCEETPLDLDLRKYYDAGSALNFVDVSNPASGTLVGDSKGDGRLTYTPYPQSAGRDSFEYRVSNGKVNSSMGTVYLTVINHSCVKVSARTLDENGRTVYAGEDLELRMPAQESNIIIHL